MEKLTTDAFFSIALKLSLQDLLSFCKINKEIAKKINNRNYVWYEKLKRDFKDRQEILDNPKDLYILLSGLTDLKEKLKLTEDIYHIYFLEQLNIIYYNLEIIPPTIYFLNNLQKLSLSDNYLKEVPTVLPLSLRELDVSRNSIKTVPNNLPSFLKKLNLMMNQIEELPDTLPISLDTLYVSQNQLKKLPNVFPPLIRNIEANLNDLEELPSNLPNSLQVLNVSYNYIEELPSSLPNSLKELNINSNNITDLPYLPAYLEKLIIGKKNHMKFPTILPLSLKYLFIFNYMLPFSEEYRIKTSLPQIQIYHKL